MDADKPTERSDMMDALLAFEKPPATDLPAPAERAAIRTTFGVSQKQLAELLGVTRLSVGMWERGETEPKGENRAAYADALRRMAERNKETGKTP